MSLDFRGIHADVLADETSEIDLEGARFSGKTWLFSAKVGRACTKYPGMEWLIGRFADGETKTKVKPEFERVVGMDQGISLDWDNDARCYLFPEISGLRSRVYAYGLKTQSINEALAKVRGLGVASIWNDQTEELPQQISEELRFGTRQPGYPHQLLFSPNPPSEDHFLADQFPEENPFPHRKYYRLSLYDNAHHLPPGKIAELEALYPPTHAKYKSLVLGRRGPNVVGVPVYDHAFSRDLHVAALDIDPNAPLLEAYHAGQHHPTWMVAQRTPFGGLRVVAGIFGKRLFLEDFLPIVQKYRMDWFGGDIGKVCCDPPPAGDAAHRYTTVTMLREAGLKPIYRANGTAPDTRLSMIEYLGALMKRRLGGGEAFQINADRSRFLMASHSVVKQTGYFVDGCEGSYVWSPHYVSVSNKTVRQPLFDEWLEGWQRCLENIALNFCAGQRSDEDQAEERRRQREAFGAMPMADGPQGWMGS